MVLWHQWLINAQIDFTFHLKSTFVQQRQPVPRGSEVVRHCNVCLYYTVVQPIHERGVHNLLVYYSVCELEFGLAVCILDSKYRLDNDAATPGYPPCLTEKKHRVS